MSDVLLYLWGNKRSYLLQELDFYLTQADRRVLIQFGNLEEEAEQFARDKFDRMGQSAGPDADPGDYADAAWSEGINHYQMLSDLHGQMLLSVAAGLYHQWEKQLREWLVSELDHSFSRENVGPAIWKQKIEDLYDLLKGLGWDVRAHPFFAAIEECRLVVNVSKHGGGPSFDLLKAQFGQHLGETRPGMPVDSLDYRDHTDLKITREDLGRFQQALKDFWLAMPEHTLWSDAQTVPKWFEKALKKNR
ncbi:hypothetical protein HB780_19795 [Rhizobium lusitanum]|uniref:hypothetical protein n=1 Tax=Rhizobium lusitanum TaxID=293958 RepID=UPI001611C9CF|nr:hypothetical protein [Rhizobium lusitanum]QND47901.1 hypothetical protein HB780_19795 [Rhizobium lusitanum]